MSFYEELSKIEYSEECYISGMLALNIADYENNTGDWHRKVFWNESSKISPSHIMGSKSPVSNIDTNNYFGSKGIYKANNTLREMGVPEFSKNILAANHARSIADLVIYFASQGKNPCCMIDFYGFDDFMELPSDKEKVFTLLGSGVDNMTNPKIKQIVLDWLDRARKFSYE